MTTPVAFSKLLTPGYEARQKAKIRVWLCISRKYCQQSYATLSLYCPHSLIITLILTSHSFILFKFVMRIPIIPLLCLASSVLALPLNNLAARDTKIIENSMRDVAASLQRLTSALQSISPRMSSQEVLQRWPTVEQRCHDVSNLLTSDARRIRMGPTVSTVESTNLLSPLNQLETATQRTVDEWIAIKPAINQRDKQSVVATLKHHEAAAGEYADAILSRQSAVAAPAGRYFGSRMQTSIERAVSAYR
jgi:hypothetical protein